MITQLWPGGMNLRPQIKFLIPVSQFHLDIKVEKQHILNMFERFIGTPLGSRSMGTITSIYVEVI